MTKKENRIWVAVDDDDGNIREELNKKAKAAKMTAQAYLAFIIKNTEVSQQARLDCYIDEPVGASGKR